MNDDFDEIASNNEQERGGFEQVWLSDEELWLVQGYRGLSPDARAVLRQVVSWGERFPKWVMQEFGRLPVDE